MEKPLRILIVEDSEDDALLTILALKKGGYDPVYERVEDAGAMRKALLEKSWDVILCDYQMPQFKGPSAIAILKETGIDIPLIIVSGAIGEETAVECMRLGACDYIMKDNLHRLTSAIERELKEVESRLLRKRAEEALKESERKYKLITEKMTDIVWIVDMDLRTVYVTPSVLTMLGFSQEERMLQTVNEQLTPVSLSSGLDALAKELALEEQGHGDPNRNTALVLEYYHKDGSTRWMETIVSGIRNDQGVLTEIHGVSRNITERKKAEEALRESEEKYRNLFENANEAIFVAQDGNLVFLNPMTAMVTGFSDEELMKRPFAEFIYSDDRDMVIDRHVRRIKGEEIPPVYSFRIIHKDGNIRWVELNVVLINWKGKTATLNFLTDITERKQMEETLKKSEENYRRLFDSSPVAIYQVDFKTGKFLKANDVICEYFGCRHEEIISHSPYDLLTDESKQLFLERLNTMSLGEKVTETPEYEVIDKNGRRRWLQLYSKNIYDSEGLMGADVVAHDITERKRANETLKDTLENLRKSFGTTIQVMVSAVETRDPYTAGHQVRVADLARAIATEMGLSQDRIEAIRMAGPIHDIGKLAIPAEILSKPGKLSAIEFSLVKEHARTGYEMLKDVESPWPLAQIVYQHHERMDGSGYPRKLKGDDILMEARIMAVADVVESMASHRPYRPALGINTALEEIEKNKGILYDDTVADACLRLFREKGFQIEGT